MRWSATVVVLTVAAWLAAREADARSCIPNSQYEPEYSSYDEPKTSDFVPWFPIYVSDAARVRDATCRFVASDQELPDLAVEVELVPPESEFSDDTELVIAWFRPATPFGPATTYTLTCGLTDPPWPAIYLTTDAAIGRPVPFPHVENVERIDGGSQCSCAEDGLELTLSAELDETFFAEGGILLIEYGPDRITYASNFFDAPSRIVSIPLPRSGEERITLTPITGSQSIGSPIEVDVRGLGGDDSGCRHARAGRSSMSALVVLGSILLLRRRRRSARTA